MNCLNCNTYHIPNEANYCPQCGAPLRCELYICAPYPANIKKGERTRLYYDGVGIVSVEISGVKKFQNKIKAIYLTPESTKSYLVLFRFANGTRENKIITITVE